MAVLDSGTMPSCNMLDCVLAACPDVMVVSLGGRNDTLVWHRCYMLGLSNKSCSFHIAVTLQELLKPIKQFPAKWPLPPWVLQHLYPLTVTFSPPAISYRVESKGVLDGARPSTTDNYVDNNDVEMVAMHFARVHL